MLRLLDVRRALESRGYPEAVSARLELEVQDDCIPENSGRFVLDVSGGKAEVRTGGSGRLRLHVRGLAALYTGFLSHVDLGLLRLAEGEPRDLALAGALFFRAASRHAGDLLKRVSRMCCTAPVPRSRTAALRSVTP